MSIVLADGQFIATCDNNRYCVQERRRTSHTQRVLAIDTTAPEIAAEILHADDAKASERKRKHPLEGLTLEQKRQLEAFRAELAGAGWIVGPDRSQPLGLTATCRYHNPATTWPRPPPDLDW